MECSQEANREAAERAKKERPGVLFGSLSVQLVSIEGSKVGFIARGEDDRPHRFSVDAAQVWLGCPGTARNLGDYGTLMITREGIEVVSSDDGKTKLKDRVQVHFKWPDSGRAAQRRAAVEIWPIDIVVKGYAYGDPAHVGEVSLLDLARCGEQQALRVEPSRPLTLSLTREGLAAFGLEVPGTLAELRWALAQQGGGEVTYARHRGAVVLAERVVTEWREKLASGELEPALEQEARALLEGRPSAAGPGPARAPRNGESLDALISELASALASALAQRQGARS